VANTCIVEGINGCTLRNYEGGKLELTVRVV
jgi:hypothetical protein